MGGVHNLREHTVSMEVWEAVFRSIEIFTAHSNTNNLEEIIVDTLCAFAKLIVMS